MPVELLTIHGKLTLGHDGPPEAPDCERCKVSRAQVRLADFNRDRSHDYCATCLLEVAADAAAFRELVTRSAELGLIPADGRVVRIPGIDLAGLGGDVEHDHDWHEDRVQDGTARGRAVLKCHCGAQVDPQ